MSTSTRATAPTGRVLTIWTPEDKAFWEREGEAIAKINLWISVPALFLAFAIWQVWSVVAVSLPALGFNYSTDQLFWLAAAPALSGATLRIFYSFMVPIFGGRRWTAISTALLLIPAIGIGVAVQDNTTPYATMLVLALLCGFGGGNFSSSMANISFFFPKERKGSALGVNAGLGNLGVSVVQFLSPLVVTAGIFGIFGGEAQTIVKNSATVQVWTQNAAFIWVPWIALASLAAWFGMNDIADAKASFAAQAAIFRRKHNWLMCVLYLGTFGSFIGYAAGFPLLIKSQFPGVNPLAYAWLGPLVGALVRPFGGWLADKLGGARVSFWNFVVMALAVGGVLLFLPRQGAGGHFTGFFLMFLVLFLTTGIGNGSTFRMIPVIFLNQALKGVDPRDAEAVARATREGNTEGAAALGFTAAMAAYGGFFIPKSYGTSITLTGGPEAALYLFIVFYLLCIAITWWQYSRRNAPMPC
ncbi:MAG: NarK family nitrate/nitrite MFS transporter [Comamonadaceae bacterium]|jgi:NNP family nitrate/nitrite transporter-like MFS transporter|uniref:Nitrate/nitrite transporter n=1 Tax=Hydrogenophaga borbori TaxID=2294117 RepID=A0A372EL74_9BURK|nr:MULTISPECIES: NarK family nitrate/nitrite MFS transporter [Hydrogenophaga]NCT96471.1 NarK family nitrate/nitrite MFS transporter [Comamonadaceae bacterium]RFP80035.1 NarK family nitrate/nitrite MFS transporter [Hydrogenophaga borbori]WQB84990.1 NarK family nitrate/nitrite MFS transporter [Hydrogenophaga sp. SNF1]